MTSYSQEPEDYFRTGNPYFKFVSCSFECDFSSKKIVITTCCDTIRYYNNFLVSFLNSDSTYKIELTVIDKMDSNLFEKTYHYNGKYEIDHKGTIHLNGDHPFNSNIIKMKVKEDEYSVDIYGYKFKLGNQFRWINNRKLSTFCDGGSTFYNDFNP